MQDLLAASALDQAQAVRDGEVTATELVEAALAKAESVQDELNAFAMLDADGALAAAADVGPGDPRFEQLVLRHDEVLAQDRRVDRLTNRL